MTSPAPIDNVQVASVSDRGLSEKRPMNEDSFLVDPAHHIFAVADGVGGADAGEVASQTAIEVMQEAFQHLKSGDDVEDLMELSIQRANASIHQMAIDNPRFSMMATTIVALHLDGDRATIGHVGDSRLYRLEPDGKLNRETADHSIVEEEVRAGRMTPEQAANHPSKNVISRALGAETSVEVDMKTIEVQEGTAFLLCTDGITRHIPDPELREVLTSGRPPKEICATLKERCYERGAEDNLTAVIVQVGTLFHEALIDDERTIDLAATAPLNPPPQTETHLTPASRIAFPGPGDTQPSQFSNAQIPRSSRSGVGKFFLRLFVFLLLVGVAVAAFFGGMKFQDYRAGMTASVKPQPTPNPTASLEQKRSAVDVNPQQWLDDTVRLQLVKEGISKPTDSTDPEFLYLYGRAQMLLNNHRQAMQAFELALNNIRNESRTDLPLSAEVKVAEASAALKLQNQPASAKSQEALQAEQKAVSTLDELLGIKRGASPK